MPEFIPNRPVASADSLIEVESLGVGRHRFQLVVVDDGGLESEPAILEIIVTDNRKPTAVLDMVDADGRPIRPRAEAGQSIRLSGARSSDPGSGTIVEYRFTLID